MILTYFENKSTTHLVDQYFELIFDKSCIPFQTTVLPLGIASITHIFSEGQKVIVGKEEIPLKDLILTSQFYKSYEFIVSKEATSFGITFHPTAIHKIFGIDLSNLHNKHIPLKKMIDETTYNQVISIFQNYTNPKKTVLEIGKFITKTKLNINQNTIMIDKVIDLIKEKDGLLSIDSILSEVKISQKTLETQFKKIVGITPGKYIRLFRFLNLMKRYEKHEIDLKDLIYMYNYYDSSHFNKDFKLFMNDSPISYFNREHPLIKKLLQN